VVVIIWTVDDRSMVVGNDMLTWIGVERGEEGRVVDFAIPPRTGFHKD
jgi:hypothetical protein